MNSFLELFGNYIDESVSAYFDGATVESIEASLADRSVHMAVSFPQPVDSAVIRNAKAEITRVMNLRTLDFAYRFPPETLDMGYLNGFVKEICESFPPAKSILDGAEYNLTNDRLTVNLAANGRDVLINLGVDKFIRKALDSRFERLVHVEFISSVSAHDDIENLQKLQENSNKKIIESKPIPTSAQPSAKEASKTPVQKQPKQQAYEDLPISITNARPLYGGMVKGKPKPIKDCMPDDGEVIVWGDIFSVDAKESRDGRFTIINFNTLFLLVFYNFLVLYNFYFLLLFLLSLFLLLLKH